MPDVLLESTGLAWLAGFIDADGHIGIRYSNQGDYSLHLTIGGTHRPSIELCQRMLGGGFYEDKRRPPRKQAWRTHIGGARTKEMLALIYPYMVTKRHQAAIALVYPITSGHRGIPAPPLQRILQEECYRAIGKLNKKGRPVA